MNNIYPLIYDKQNIQLAHRMARKDKSFYEAVQKTDENLEERTEEISNMLKNHTYKVGLYKTSRYKDKGKERILYKLPYYPDRIIQWAIMLNIEKYFNKIFMPFVCASLPQRGIHYASKLLDHYLQDYPDKTTYYLKFDIKKFYPSINRNILKQLLRKPFKDKDLLTELDKIIDSFDKTDVYKLNLTNKEKAIYCRPGYGVPVGSYLSQYLANFYLSYFDHWLIEECGCVFAVRYMDDILILSDSKEFLHNLFCVIKTYLKEKLDLEIKNNYIIRPTYLGIDIVGYRHFYGYKLLRNKTKKHFKEILLESLFQVKNKFDLTEKNYNACISIAGWLCWANTYNFYKKYFYPLFPYLGVYYFFYKQSPKKKINHTLNIWLKYENKYKLNKCYGICQSHLAIH